MPQNNFFCVKVCLFKIPFVIKQMKHLVLNFGSKDIGNTVRSVLWKLMTDVLITGFNRTGGGGKQMLPKVLITCLISK